MFRRPAEEETIFHVVKNLGERVILFIIRIVQDFAPIGEVAPLNWLERLIKVGKTDNFGLLVEMKCSLPQETLALREKAVEVEALQVQIRRALKQ